MRSTRAEEARIQASSPELTGGVVVAAKHVAGMRAVPSPAIADRSHFHRVLTIFSVHSFA